MSWKSRSVSRRRPLVGEAQKSEASPCRRRENTTSCSTTVRPSAALLPPGFDPARPEVKLVRQAPPAPPARPLSFRYHHKTPPPPSPTQRSLSAACTAR